MERGGLTRREFAKLTGSAAAIGLFARACANAPRSIELVQPQTRSATNGNLQTRFDLAFSPNLIGGQSGGQKIYTRCYEGMVPGPTLRLRAGDVLNLQICNHLPPNTDLRPINLLMPHLINSTNLHSHGLHVSPSGNSDNVLVRIHPSGSSRARRICARDPRSRRGCSLAT